MSGVKTANPVSGDVAPPQRHSGRIALITGASSGLGAQFARMLAASGAKVIIGARRADRLDALVGEIERAGGSALAVPLDVRDESAIIAAYDAAEARFGTVDTVIANAGINVHGEATDLAAEDYDAIQAVNGRGVFLTVREGGRRLLAAADAAPRGRILILASMAGIDPLPHVIAYSTSKASAVMLGRAFALDWAKTGICVNVLCPGYLLTEMTGDWLTSDQGERFIARMPRRRLMPITALDPIVAHLTSDEAAYTSGTVIRIDDAQRI